MFKNYFFHQVAAVLDYGYEVSNIWILYNLFDVLLDFEKYLLTEWEGCTGKYLPTGKDIQNEGCMVCKSWQEPNIFLSSLIKLSQWAFIIWTLSVENVDNFVSTWIGCKRRAHGGQLGDSTLKTFPFFLCQNKNQIHQKKWAFFPHFYLPLSLINWKVSTYENQNWKIQGKSFCINLAITVKYVILLMYMNCFFHCSMLCSYQLLYYLHLAFWYISA